MTPGSAKNISELMARNIKDVLQEYPSVGAVLTAADIGCVTCAVGTCKMADVVTIHNLTPEQERDLFARISAAAFPGQPVELPRPRQDGPTRAAAPRKLSPPVVELMDEHKYIKRVIALIPALAARFAAGIAEVDKRTALQIVDFVRNFADRYHHAKEEDLLFKQFDEGADIIQAMYTEHETGRAHIRAAVEAMERGDARTAREQLTAYGALLSEHIRKEDEILYPWMDRGLSDSQIGQLFGKFRDVEVRFENRPAQYRALVLELEARLQQPAGV